MKKKKKNKSVLWLIVLILIFCIEVLLTNCEKPTLTEDERQEQLKKVYEYMKAQEGKYSSTDLQSAKGY
jgi:hypothetical protein